MIESVRYRIGIMLFCMGSMLLSGCGYSMQSTLDQKYQTVHVSSFKNQSREYDLQAPLTNAVIRKFMNDGRLRVVNKGLADLVVDGTILDYELKGITFSNDDEVTQFEMRVFAKVRVIEPRTGDVLWSSDRLVSETSYSTPEGGTSTDRLRGNTRTFLPAVRSFATEAENHAAAEALEQLSSTIFYRTIEPW